MDRLSKYNLAFKGLSLGVHRFEYRVDDAFFASFDGSEVTKGHADVSVAVLKQPGMLTLDFHIEGSVMVTCDRCLEEFPMPVDYDGTLLVKFSEAVGEPGAASDSDGEVMWLHPSETEVNLAQYIYESILLSLPYQRVLPEDANGVSGCNPDMLKKFRIVSEEEFGEMFGDAASEGDGGAGSPADAEEESSWEKQLAALKRQMESKKNDND